MKYRATIRVRGEGALIRKVFASEDTTINERARYSLKQQGQNVVFTIEAEDGIGLRTALNSVTKILTVIEKMKEI